MKVMYIPDEDLLIYKDLLALLGKGCIIMYILDLLALK
jgi:hypothetical protein